MSTIQKANGSVIIGVSMLVSTGVSRDGRKLPLREHWDVCKAATRHSCEYWWKLCRRPRISLEHFAFADFEGIQTRMSNIQQRHFAWELRIFPRKMLRYKVSVNIWFPHSIKWESVSKPLTGTVLLWEKWSSWFHFHFILERSFSSLHSLNNKYVFHSFAVINYWSDLFWSWHVAEMKFEVKFGVPAWLYINCLNT